MAIKKTQTLRKNIISRCPECGVLVRGEIFEKNGEIYLKYDCRKHGTITNLYFKDSKFYKKNLKKSDKNKVKTNKNYVVKNPNEVTTSLHINLTYDCNLNCPTCFASVTKNKKDISILSIEELEEQIKPFLNSKNKPMIILFGGEPTLSSDLFEYIKKLKSWGFVVRLSTNGLRLADEKFVRELKEAGLDWVLLQFDGFDPSIYKKLRGRDLLPIKKQIIKNLEKYQIKTHLLAMICSGINDQEISKLINYSLAEKNVYALNFYPSSSMGKNLLRDTYFMDVLREIESQSNGSIKIKDFLRMKSVLKILYILFKKPIFRTIYCAFPNILFKIKDEVFNITKLLNPIFVIKNLKYLLKLIPEFPSLFKWDRNPSKRFLYFNVEKFFDDTSLEMEGLINCHNMYLTKEGCVPFCVFNHLF